MISISDKNDAISVLNNLKILRVFKGEIEEFWNYFLKNSAYLCKSPYSSVLSSLDKNNWQEFGVFSENDTLSSSKKTLHNLAISTIDRIEKNGYSFEPINSKVEGINKPFLVSFRAQSVDVNEFIIVSLIVDRNDVQYFNEMVVRTQLISDVYLNYRNNLEKEKVDVNSLELRDSRINEVLELLNLVRDEKKFVLACMKLADELSNKFESSQVSISWLKGEYLRCMAISHLESFDKNSDIVEHLESVYEECADQEDVIVLPEGEGVVRQHQKYLQVHGLESILSLPIIVNDDIVGVITLEKKEGLFDEQEVNLLKVALHQLSSWLDELFKKDRWIGSKITYKLRSSLSWFLGVNNTFLKLASIIFMALIFYSIFFKWEYKIEVKATLETDNIAYLSAPYNGFVKNVNYHSGDSVNKDSILLNLDIEELLLKELEAQSDVIRFTREAEKARAKRELANMNIAIARIKQANAILKRTRYYISQSKIKAPFDGIIVDGEKQELIGSPVSKGDLLLKVANPTDIYAKFKVNERDIDELKEGLVGELKLLSRPNLYFPIKVKKIIPIAQVDNKEGNVFILKANFSDGTKDWFRPGMSGIAKIDMGERRIIWILTHRTIDFLRMYFWL